MFIVHDIPLDNRITLWKRNTERQFLLVIGYDGLHNIQCNMQGAISGGGIRGTSGQRLAHWLEDEFTYVSDVSAACADMIGSQSEDVAPPISPTPVSSSEAEFRSPVHSEDVVSWYDPRISL